MTIIGLDHVQIAAPAGCERDARRFYGEALRDVAWDRNRPGTRRLHVRDPFGNRVEIRAR